jgi:hypothetical protein
MDEPKDDTCPKCGCQLEHGFGLAGGGYGSYVFCSREGCDYFYKWQEEE